MGIEGTYLNIITIIYDKPTANILNGENLKVFPLRSGTRQGYILLPLLFNVMWEVLATAIKCKSQQSNVKLFADGILYMENPKDAIKKQIDLINEFSKVAGHKINIQKSV